MTIQLRINNIYNNNYASANTGYYINLMNGRSIHVGLIIWIFFSNAIPNC